MEIKNKLLVFCLSLTTISSAFAKSSEFVSPQKSRFNVGIDALYLRPNTDNLVYALLLNNNNNATNSNDYQVVNPAYDWGFYAHTSYQFPCSGYDINVAYTHFNTSDSDSVAVQHDTLQTLAVIPLSSYGLGDVPFKNATANVNFGLNVVDVDVGRHIDGKEYNVRLFGGLRYANFNSDTYVEATTMNNVLANQKDSHDFRGFGPMLGAEGRYALYGRWGVDSCADMAFLIGQINSKYQMSIGSNTHQNFQESKNSAVPMLEAKIGLDYTYDSCRDHSRLVFETGYQATGYFSSLTNLNGVLLGDSMTNSAGKTSDLSFNGVYFGAKYYV